jgi:hypothetical protein
MPKTAPKRAGKRAGPGAPPRTDRTPKKARAGEAVAKRRAAALLKRRKAVFLQALTDTHQVVEAAAAAEVGRSTVYEWRASDVAFASAWADVLEASTELLEREAFRRAAEGTDKPVYHQGELVDTYKEFSDVLLMFLLKARRPDVYRESHKLELGGVDGAPISAEILTVNAKEAADAAQDFLARLAGPAA